MSGMPMPVFAYPDELTFYAIDREYHKQMLSLYNPYGFPVRYKISCTAPDLFDVRESEGVLSDRHTISLVVRLSQVPPYSVVPIQNKFRVQIFDGRTRTRQHSAQKIIVAKISFDPVPPPEEPPMSSAGSESGRMYRSEGSTSAAAVAAANAAAAAERDIELYRGHGGGGGGGHVPPHVNYVAVVTAIVCIFALLLPNEKEPSPTIPIYLHLSINMKLMIAYALGLATMVIFRP